MENDIVKQIDQLDRLIKKYVSQGQDPRKEFNPTQFNIIDYLMNRAGEDVCQKDLEQETGLKKASITGSLDSLVEKGVVYRQQSKEDKRKNYVKLTDLALSRKQLFDDRIKEVNMKIVEKIPLEDLEVFFQVLNAITANVEQELD